MVPDTRYQPVPDFRYQRYQSVPKVPSTRYQLIPKVLGIKMECTWKRRGVT
ncbi:hypothetical protein OsJ_32098 [Oryza sativa Japonica Group]|uniref:Uncharacterized protein n=3 Tax=Oryza sativa subsp. japonica TaxID=39947 RepID=B9G6J2_ORYSJ|nr:hypothetical protein OsJ_32098 [Oryza sativa Japonica Group]